MRKIIFALLLFVSNLTIPCPAQDITTVQPKDTSLYLVQLYTPEFVLEQTLNTSPFSFGAPEQFPKYFYQSSASSPAPLLWEFQNEIDIAAPWKLQLAKENENRTLYMILSSINAGGALYLAYRHVKKYGFW